MSEPRYYVTTERDLEGLTFWQRATSGWAAGYGIAIVAFLWAAASGQPALAILAALGALFCRGLMEVCLSHRTAIMATIRARPAAGLTTVVRTVETGREVRN